MWKGIARCQIGDYLLAEQQGREALERDPENPYPHRFLGDLYRLWGNTRYALDEYEQAIRFSAPNQPADELLFLSGWMMLDQDQIEEGKSRIQLAGPSLKDPGKADALLALRLSDENALRRLKESTDPREGFIYAISNPSLKNWERVQILKELLNHEADKNKTETDPVVTQWARAALNALETEKRFEGKKR